MPFCHPDKIKIGDRLRNTDVNAAEVLEMADSIKECGQLQPALVTKDMELVDGLHRLLACKRLNRDVWFETEETAQIILESPLQRRRAELQANIRRKEFTPMQLARGIAELDRLMREIYGSKKAGPGADSGWTQAETAKMLGYKSQNTVSEAIIVAEALEKGNVPALSQARTMQEAVKMVRDTARMEAIKELAKRQSSLAIENPHEFFSQRVILGDCLAGMRELESSICSLFITDPPFGVDLDRLVKWRPEVLGKSQTIYEDKREDISSLLNSLIPEMSRVGKPSCQVFMFCASDYYNTLMNAFRDVGFNVYNKPFVWVKARKEPFRLVTGRTFDPATRPGSAYEMAIYAWRGDARLAQQGRPDVFVHPRVQDAVHQAQKPIPLMMEIIARFYHPGTNPLLIDPFAGVCSTLIAARRLGIKQYFGYEINPEFRERGIAQMVMDYLKGDIVLDLEDFEQ